MPIAIWAQRITVRCNNWHRQHASHFLGNIRLDGLACARSDANGAQNCFSSSLGIRRTLRHSASIPMAEWTDHSMGLETAHAHTNRLANEESPYLLQHQHNPVDWYPWGPEAFQKARVEDKPIFLSVGYSTCHWCHVMERESFENDGIAELLNAHFVSIKVDKEERPDVDRLYMTYVQATQGGGGWPMSVFLTPDLQPFLGGTYFPPTDSYGRPGFGTLLQRIAQVWAAKRDLIREQAADTMSQLAAALAPEGNEAGTAQEEVAGKALAQCANQLGTRFDVERGGFGPPPKFPRPAEINALLLHHLQALASSTKPQSGDSLHMALVTLQRMAAGGMYDHVGGGFHRYSVDEFWHVPHFEKMLYDNAQLAVTYLDASRLTQNPQYFHVVRGILDYLMRDMTHPDGGIFSAEDADSLSKAGKKMEGAFYLWAQAEIEEVLSRSPEATELFKRLYYVKPEGNCDLSPRSDPHAEFGGLNCLIRRSGLFEVAGRVGVSEKQADELLAQARKALHEQRQQRPRPHLDNKVVAAWNGMSISAFALAGRALQSETPPASPSFPVEGRDPAQYLQAAVRIAEFVHDKLWDQSEKRLRRSFCRGPSEVRAFADDYAYMVQGLLDLYFCTGAVRWLRWALQLQTVMDDQFWDPVGGGYYSTAGEDPSILLRLKEDTSLEPARKAEVPEQDYDGAEPAPTSIAVANLLRLAALAEPDTAEALRERARQAIAAFQERLGEAALAVPQLCCSAHLFACGHLRQVVIAGPASSPETQALLNAAHAPFAPDKVVVVVDLADEQTVDFWRRHNPTVLAMAERGYTKGEASAFICQNFTCQAPTSDPEMVRSLLSQPPGAFTPANANAAPTTVDLSTLKASASFPQQP